MQPEIKIYNSLSRKKEVLKEVLPEAKKLRLFVCGPTVYDYAHIGHARTYIFFDFFAKYLRSQGYEVNYLQNITDIDDKIIKRAAEENKTPVAIADFFTDAYLEDMRLLGIEGNVAKDIKSLDFDGKIKYAPATKFIPEIISQVERLIKKNFAYKIDGDGWYFDISKDNDYGKLSGRTAVQAEDAVSRIDEAAGKRNKGDFCLWKFSKPGEPVWAASIGAGRPGWHIEDTAITEYFFGPQYDIHGGGVDLKFPHHEAEIAQQESAAGIEPKKFVKIWMHTGTLLVDGKKMSKSLGNFVTVRDFLKRYSVDVLRFMILGHHYRMPMDYNDKLAIQAEKNLENIEAFLLKVGLRLNYLKENPIDIIPSEERINISPARFESALVNDFNTPVAISAILLTVTDSNRYFRAINKENLIKTRDFIEKTLNILGIRVKKFQISKIPKKIQDLAEKREEFRSNKQFNHSDRLRKEIEGLGYEIEDTPNGPFLWPKNPNLNSRRKI